MTVDKEQKRIYDSIVGRRHPGGSTAPSPPNRLINRCRGAIMRICKIEGCNNLFIARGYCNKHYKRWLLYDDPLRINIEKHGMTKTSEYRTWAGMKSRCYNINHPLYYRYGVRGITVCQQWKNSFLTFYKDMGLRPFSKAQIDRIDNDKGYYQKNCKWSTCAENIRNCTVTKLTIEIIKEIRNKYKIENITQKQLGKLYGVGADHISRIINYKRWKLIK